MVFSVPERQATREVEGVALGSRGEGRSRAGNDGPDMVLVVVRGVRELSVRKRDARTGKRLPDSVIVSSVCALSQSTDRLDSR